MQTIPITLTVSLCKHPPTYNPHYYEFRMSLTALNKYIESYYFLNSGEGVGQVRKI